MTTLQITTIFLPVPIGLSAAMWAGVIYLKPSRWVKK